MDDQRLGAALRAVRIKRGWTQAELGARAGVSSSVVSLVERGHLDSLSLIKLRRIALALDVRLDMSARMRAGELDRLVHAGHAAMHEELAATWAACRDGRRHPRSRAVYAEHGVIDILAFHAPSAALLVIELKTELVSVEDLLGTMDVRLRHAARIARDRGWQATSVSGWVVFADTRPNRRRVGLHAATLRSAFPADGHAMRRWLGGPDGSIRALSFWPISNAGGARQLPALRRRVRKPKSRCVAA